MNQRRTGSGRPHKPVDLAASSVRCHCSAHDSAHARSRTPEPDRTRTLRSPCGSPPRHTCCGLGRRDAACWETRVAGKTSVCSSSISGSSDARLTPPVVTRCAVIRPGHGRHCSTWSGAGRRHASLDSCTNSTRRLRDARYNPRVAGCRERLSAAAQRSRACWPLEVARAGSDPCGHRGLDDPCADRTPALP